MTTASNPAELTIQPGYEPIPGYRVDSLLGRGGFGEVWKCQAPGGMYKAIKFVYGAVDQDRATRELKSLNRIKGAQHPFLLTLERFEFVAGRLVIVTELADGSLEDEFNQRRARGSCGIPREQLLVSLSDAADALDYLHQRHQLLHLDVKPGNLLLQGGHVKVADFGLLKDLKDLECSIVAGLTPVYAPPELFDGRPSIHSDQYSLAVVYQELLTGVRPFTGRTIAQLATQHIHAAPNLSPLLPADRPVIARALEKNPDRRFSSCRDFLAALHQSGHRASPLSSGIPKLRESDTSANDTSLGQFPGFLGAPQVAVDELPSLSLASNFIRERTPAITALRHALVIGLGGVGRECLDQLHQLINQPRESQPLAVHSLLIDTDFDSLHGADEFLQGNNPSTIQTLYLPLRTAREYQQVQDGRLSSISRRWLFNVPRNGQTVGMRPLGRLALVDHSQRLARALDGIVSQFQSLTDQESPAIYVVGSLDGGTGSGMVFDVMHLLRDRLDKHGMEHGKVIPLLTTTALMSSQSPTLAAHNSACALGEMGHLVKIANGYPGDTAVGWPSVPAARSPLSEAYVIAAGDDNSATPMPAHTIAEYIWLDGAFAGSVLNAARELEGERRLADLASATLRSVGVFRLAFQQSAEETLHAPMMALRVTEQWCGSVVDDEPTINQLMSRYVPEDALTQKAVMRDCLGEWSESRGERLERLAQWRPQHLGGIADDFAVLNESLKTLADQTFGDVSKRDRMCHWSLLQQRLISDLGSNQLTLHEALALIERLRRDAEMAQSKIESGSGQEAVLEMPAVPASAGEVVAYCERWLWRAACQSAAHVYTELLVSITEFGGRLTERLQVIRQLTESLTAALQAQSSPTWDKMGATWQQRATIGVQRLQQQWTAALLIEPILHRQKEQSTTSILSEALEEAAGLARALRLSETDAIAAGGEVQLMPRPAPTPTPTVSVAANPRSLLFTDEPDELTTEHAAVEPEVQVAAVIVMPEVPELPAEPIQATKRDSSDYQALASAALEAVRPRLLDCGGSQRLLLMVGSEHDREVWEAAIRENHSGSLTTVLLPGVPATLVCEAQKIKLSDVRSRVIASLGGREDVLARLHSRCDIKWS